MIKKVNLREQAKALDKLFEYKRVGILNNHMLNVLQAEDRILEFHIHENSDEMFYCISLVKCLLIEKEGTLNKENTGGRYDEK